jgi:glucose/arabinose dehydrogenase
MSPWRSALPAAVLLALVGAAGPAVAEPPPLSVEVVASGLEIPWDVSPLADGGLLYTERDSGQVSLRTASGQTRVVLDNPTGMWNSGETGLMAVEADVTFASDRAFFTCHGYNHDGVKDVRVVRWRLNAEMTRASVDRVIVRGLPATSGRHGGCALQLGSGRGLYIGTGDAATGRNPQNLASGGGKVLRVYGPNGEGYSSNPYGSSKNAMTKRIWTYGHRNVQGLTRRTDGSIYAIEQGSSRDDEANWLVKGGNYGWNPVPRRPGDPSYNEGANSPMTDYDLPGAQKAARWSSGSSTIATSGGTFVNGSAWGDYNGTLAVAALKDQSLRFLKEGSNGKYTVLDKPAELDGTYGRLRAAVQGPDGSLYLTTSNGSDDKILRVTPGAR